MRFDREASAGLIGVLVLVISLREFFVWLLGLAGYEAAGSLLAMLVLLGILLTLRWSRSLPHWLEVGSNRLLTESAFAYLPVCAAGGMLLFTQLDRLYGVLFISVAVTLFTLKWFGWVSARAITQLPVAVDAGEVPLETGIDLQSEERFLNQQNDHENNS